MNNEKTNMIPKLYFFGCGSAFNTKMGNTSAFTILDNEILVLFDVTYNAYQTIVENPTILKNIKEIKICLTHTHPDHVNGLCDLLFYIKYGINEENNDKKIAVNILCPDTCMYERVVNLLKTHEINCSPQFIFDDRMLCIDVTYSYMFLINTTKNKYQIRFKLNTYHFGTLAYYIYLIKGDGSKMGADYSYIIYTGDTSAFPPSLNDYDFSKCEQIYIDCSTETNISNFGHYSASQIMDTVNIFDDESLNINKITPMHFQDNDVYATASLLGMNLPEVLSNDDVVDVSRLDF